jgi:hypothetical protein
VRAGYGDFERSCGSKRAYTKSQAKKQARRARQRSGHTDIRPYRCGWGRHYHIGHHRPDRRSAGQAAKRDMERRGGRHEDA